MIDVVIEFSDGTYRLPAAEVTIETERKRVASVLPDWYSVPTETSRTVTIKTDLPMPRQAEPEGRVVTFDAPTRDADDPVDAPSHYTRGSIEVKDFIADQGFGFFLGSAVKYVSRAGYKGDAVEDLRKAQKMIDFEIELIEKQAAADNQRDFDFDREGEDEDDEWRPSCDCC